jgi:hypothetical protein
MRRIFSFWGLCAKRAAWGNSVHANDWQWVVANPLWQSIGAAVGVAVGGFWKGAPTLSPDTALGVLLGGAVGFAITWLLAFLIKLLKAPADLYFEQKARAEKMRSINEIKIYLMRFPNCALKW